MRPGPGPRTTAYPTYEKILAEWTKDGNTATIPELCKIYGVKPTTFTSWKSRKVSTANTKSALFTGTPTKRPYRRKAAVTTIEVPTTSERLVALIGSQKAVMEAVRNFQ
jgi:hypothetical protein